MLGSEPLQLVCGAALWGPCWARGCLCLLACCWRLDLLSRLAAQPRLATCWRWGLLGHSGSEALSACCGRLWLLCRSGSELLAGLGPWRARLCLLLRLGCPALPACQAVGTSAVLMHRGAQAEVPGWPRRVYARLSDCWHVCRRAACCAARNTCHLLSKLVMGICL